MNSRTQHRGFTLVEVLVASAVSAMLLAGVMAFYIQNAKGMYASEQRQKLAAGIKKFANELTLQASRSNQFILFKSATPADFDGTNSAPDANDSDRQIINVSDPANPLHPAGDLVVFVYYEIPKPTAQPAHRISKLEGYFLSAATAGGTGAVKKFIIDLSGSPSTSTAEAIMTAAWGTLRFTTYFPLVRGSALPEVVDGTPVSSSTPPPARLFYMSDARNVLISGQIYSSTNNTSTGDWKTYTNSFFFNITPRT